MQGKPSRLWGGFQVKIHIVCLNPGASQFDNQLQDDETLQTALVQSVKVQAWMVSG